MQTMGVIGAGAFGTAMAQVAARAGRDVVIWAIEEEVVQSINTRHVNEPWLKDVELSPRIRATNDLAEACATDAVMTAVPSQHLRSVMTQAASHWQAGVPAMTCSKGVERETCRLMAEVVGECLGPDVTLASMGGPTFASEISIGLPAATAIGCRDLSVAEALAQAISSETFRAYVTEDIVGVQLGGAVKNVLAIACGIVSGRGLGDNARAALITRGLAEMSRLGQVLGAEPQTLMGLSGLGDTSLTCNATQSRNFSLGYELGQGRKIDDILAERHTVAEGYFNAETVTELARRNQVDMPICLAVEAVLSVDADLEAIVHGLLSRPLVHE